MDRKTPPAQPEPSLASGTRAPVWDRLPEEPPFDHLADDVDVDHLIDDPYARVADDTVPTPVSPPSGPPVVGAPRRRGGWLQTIVAGILGAVLAVSGLLYIQDDDPAPDQGLDAAALLGDVGAADPEPTADQTPTAVPDAGSPDAVAIGETVIPSIVTVQVLTSGTMFASGSGVVYEDGYIITNNHVVEDGSSYQVVLSDGRTTYNARLVGTDPLTDLAVLEVDTAGLTPIELGATGTLRVGDTAVAVGSPLGLDGGPSLTVGVVSAFGRQVTVASDETLYGMLQTDAPITQGSSGGALVDGQGRLIGITTAVGVSDVGIEGIGFATPVELVDRVVAEIISEGSVAHAFLGITGDTRFSTDVDGASVAVGVNVATVEPSSAALTAGLQPGELITAIDGEAVTTMEDLIVSLRYLSAGDLVTLTVSDGISADRVVDVTLGLR